jgi:hypothetical protein
MLVYKPDYLTLLIVKAHSRTTFQKYEGCWELYAAAQKYPQYFLVINFKWAQVLVVRKSVLSSKLRRIALDALCEEKCCTKWLTSSQCLQLDSFNADKMSWCNQLMVGIGWISVRRFWSVGFVKLEFNLWLHLSEIRSRECWWIISVLGNTEVAIFRVKWPFWVKATLWISQWEVSWRWSHNWI